MGLRHSVDIAKLARANGLHRALRALQGSAGVTFRPSEPLSGPPARRACPGTDDLTGPWIVVGTLSSPCYIAYEGF